MRRQIRNPLFAPNEPLKDSPFLRALYAEHLTLTPCPTTGLPLSEIHAQALEYVSDGLTTPDITRRLSSKQTRVSKILQDLGRALTPESPSVHKAYIARRALDMEAVPLKRQSTNYHLLGQLSLKQLYMMHMLSTGLKADEVGAVIDHSKNAVGVYVGRAYETMLVNNLPGALRVLYEQGIFKSPYEEPHVSRQDLELTGLTLPPQAQPDWQNVRQSVTVRDYASD